MIVDTDNPDYQFAKIRELLRHHIDEYGVAISDLDALLDELSSSGMGEYFIRWIARNVAITVKPQKGRDPGEWTQKTTIDWY